MSHGRRLIARAGAGMVGLSSVALAACGSRGRTATQTMPSGGSASATGHA
jgi:hypothetical protein